MHFMGEVRKKQAAFLLVELIFSTLTITICYQILLNKLPRFLTFILLLVMQMKSVDI